MTVGVVCALAAWMVLLQAQNRLDFFDWRASGWLLLGWVMMAAFAAAIWRSRSGIKNGELYQRLFWTKQVAEHDIVYARMVRISGLNWLVAPRLYIRTQGLTVMALYAADARVLERFQQVAASRTGRPTNRKPRAGGASG